jgi:hypothetical protein
MRAQVCALMITLCLAASAPGLAQEGAGAPAIQEARSAARALAEKGFELFEAGKFAEAFAHFQQAETRFHAPPHLNFMARAQEKLGKLTAARDLYQKVLDEKLANYAPDEFRQAQADARVEIEAVKKRIPTLQIMIKGVAPETASVNLDGAALPAGAAQAPRQLDPGSHLIESTVAGASARKSITLKEGAREVVELDLTPGAKPEETAPPLVPDEPTTTGERPRLLVPAIAAFGVGVVGLGVGAITGVMSLNKAADVEAKCPNDQCDPELEDDADSAKTLGTVSTITFIIGGVGVAAGAILYYLDGRAPATEASAAASTGITVRPRIGLGAVGFDGTF